MDNSDSEFFGLFASARSWLTGGADSVGVRFWMHTGKKFRF